MSTLFEVYDVELCNVYEEVMGFFTRMEGDIRYFVISGIIKPLIIHTTDKKKMLAL